MEDLDVAKYGPYRKALDSALAKDEYGDYGLEICLNQLMLLSTAVDDLTESLHAIQERLEDPLMLQNDAVDNVSESLRAAIQKRPDEPDQNDPNGDAKTPPNRR